MDGAKDEKIQVVCRLRKINDGDPTCVNLLSSDTLTLHSGVKSSKDDIAYTFKHVFLQDSKQMQIFSEVAYPLVVDVLNGKSSVLFTYGVTSSGKTYTVTGEPSHPGILPRSLDTIFNSINNQQTPKFLVKSDKMNGFELQSVTDAFKERQLLNKSSKKKPKKFVNENRFYTNKGAVCETIRDIDYAIFVSFIEIYNNIVFDLLDDATGRMIQGKIVREDAQKNMYVNNVVEVEVKSATEAFELFYGGQGKRKMASTSLNAESSRSHSIFSIRVVRVKRDTNPESQRAYKRILDVSQLNLVDLAGSERVSRTNCVGLRLREASSINNSLMTLRNCLEILRENQLTQTNRLVPYRESKLTHLFKNFFEGEGKVFMIVCVNPSVAEYEENLHVMKFAQTTTEIRLEKKELDKSYRNFPRPLIEALLTPKPIPEMEKDEILPELPESIDPNGDFIGQLQNLVTILKARKEIRIKQKLAIDNTVLAFKKNLEVFEQDLNEDIKRRKFAVTKLRTHNYK